MQEIALRFYRRLLQMGIATSELWNNIGLCCFHASQVWPMRAGCVRGFVSVCCGVWAISQHVLLSLFLFGMAV